MASDANLRSVYIGKTDLHTTTDNIRSQPSKIGVGGKVSDVQRVTTRIATENSFCVTVDSVVTENKMYRADSPAKVVIRPYRAPVSHRRNWQNGVKKGSHNDVNRENRKPYNNNRIYHGASTNSNRQNKPQTNDSRSTGMPSNTNKENYQKQQQMIPQVMYKPPYMYTPQWNGTYSGYTGQFMPLMNLGSTVP